LDFLYGYHDHNRGAYLWCQRAVTAGRKFGWRWSPLTSLGTIVEVVIGSMSMESSALDERDLRRMLTVAEVLVCSDPQAPSKVGLREFG